MSDREVTKINTIDTNRFVLQTTSNADKSGLEKLINDAAEKVPDTSRLVKKANYNSKINEAQSK